MSNSAKYDDSVYLSVSRELIIVDYREITLVRLLVTNHEERSHFFKYESST